MNTQAALVEDSGGLIGGVDTHSQTHTLAILTGQGGVMSTETFPATADGYCEMSTVLDEAGPVTAIGVEGTNSCGAGLTRALIHARVHCQGSLAPYPPGAADGWEV